MFDDAVGCNQYRLDFAETGVKNLFLFLFLYLSVWVIGLVDSSLINLEALAMVLSIPPECDDDSQLEPDMKTFCNSQLTSL